MNVCKPVTLMVPVVFLMAATGLSQGLVKVSPFPNVAVDKSGNAIARGDSELKAFQVADGAFALVVTGVGKTGDRPDEHFLAFPLNDDDPKGVRVVKEIGPACKWTKIETRFQGNAEKGVASPRVQETFSASAGPDMGKILCIEEGDLLVLLPVSKSPVYRVRVYAGIDGK